MIRPLKLLLMISMLGMLTACVNAPPSPDSRTFAVSQMLTVMWTSFVLPVMVRWSLSAMVMAELMLMQKLVTTAIRFLKLVHTAKKAAQFAARLV